MRVGDTKYKGLSYKTAEFSLWSHLTVSALLRIIFVRPVLLIFDTL